MEMKGSQLIAAPRDQVWEALNDTEVLKRSIPGCQSIRKESDTRMVATVEIKIGPIGARFNGSVELSDIVPSDSYTMSIEGQGGTVGFVKSVAHVRLADSDGDTLLTYSVNAQVGGRLAQLGGPIMDATSKQLAARFFSQFSSTFSAPATLESGVAHAGASSRVPQSTQAPARGLPVGWILALIVSALVGYLVGGGVGSGTTEFGWMGVAVGLLLLLVGAAGVEFGRRSAAPLVTIDAALLSRLLRNDQP